MSGESCALCGAERRDDHTFVNDLDAAIDLLAHHGIISGREADRLHEEVEQL